MSKAGPQIVDYFLRY